MSKGNNIILGLEEQWLGANKAFHTANEISGQPGLWKATFDRVLQERSELSEFMSNVLAHNNLDIILTGAGTSAFIGETLEAYFKKYTGKVARAVHTTDMVSYPEEYLYTTKPTLLVSFARSGNSPESVGAYNLANQLCDNVYHLVITCNDQGELAKQSEQNNSAYCFLLPKEANDKSLAMTGSFTSMIIAGVLISRIGELDLLKSQIDQLSETGQYILDNYTDKIKAIAELDFDRGVFLGSGPLLGVSRESHLKLQELTDGKVVCKFDSCLGFRHGPKAVINDNTLIVFHLASESQALRYEADLINEIWSRKDGLFRVGIGTGTTQADALDLLIELKGAESLDATLLSVVSVLPCQMLGFFKSINVGLNPDEPSKTGNIARVVRGVTIYPYENGVEKV